MRLKQLISDLRLKKGDEKITFTDKDEKRYHTSGLGLKKEPKFCYIDKDYQFVVGNLLEQLFQILSDNGNLQIRIMNLGIGEVKGNDFV